MISCAMPGKCGDAIYSLFAAKYLSGVHNCKVDFYSSSHCERLRRFIEYQSFINEFIVPPEFTDFWYAWGVHPPDMSKYIPANKYEAVYQFGYRSYPDRPLPMFAMHQNGLENINPPCLGAFDYPDIPTLDEPYVVLAPRRDLSFEKTFKRFIEICPIRIVQVGGPRETWPLREGDLDKTDIDWLDELAWISKATAFMGVISSPGAFAHNFDYPKVFPYHDGWDMRHVVQTPTTLYMPVFEKAGYGKTAEDALAFMGLL